MGVFASRSPYRPNSLGLSCVRLVGIEHSDEYGDYLVVEGADLLDGTPIYDVKPYVPTDCVKDAVCSYADKHFFDKLDVVWQCETALLTEDTRAEITACIAEDPRPSYQNDEREYGMSFEKYNVKFIVSNGVATVIECKER